MIQTETGVAITSGVPQIADRATILLAVSVQVLQHFARQLPRRQKQETGIDVYKPQMLLWVLPSVLAGAGLRP